MEVFAQVRLLRVSLAQVLSCGLSCHFSPHFGWSVFDFAGAAVVLDYVWGVLEFPGAAVISTFAGAPPRSRSKERVVIVIAITVDC